MSITNAGLLNGEDMRGLVSDIQRFSLEDGPGIRTTVFLKGCNMNCLWCHNPESISAKRPDIMFYPDKCISCYKCTTACLCKAHKKIDNSHRFFPNLCVHCGRCADVCFARALVKAGERMRVEDVLFEILQDRDYYFDSNGGVTLSGGEVFMQRDFAIEIVNRCREEGIKTAIETNISFPFDYMTPLLNEVDYVMCDIKIMDDKEHKKWTGIGSHIVIENIKRLDEMRKPYALRTPLIPGATDSDDNISQIGEFVATLNNVRLWELLNYNPLGNSKYEALGTRSVFQDTKSLGKKRLEELGILAEKTSLKRVKVR